MFCKKCANQLLNTAQFCDRCGHPVNEVAPAPQPAAMPMPPMPPISYAVPVQQAPSVSSMALPASTLRRFSNYLIDQVITFILTVLFDILFVIFVSNNPAAVFLFGLTVYLAYYAIFEATCQRTIGKLITGTKVVDRNGEKPSFLKILGRSLARYIPFDNFAFLFYGGYPIGWHDSLSKTLVVPSKTTPEEVRAMNFDEIRKQKSNNVAAIIVIVFFVILIGIAFIGFLASIVLASLNTARVKGADASVKANLSNLIPQAELYYDSNNNSYSGFCHDSQAVAVLKSASVAGNTDQNESSYTCNDSAKSYAASTPLRSGGFWCVDNLGTMAKLDTALGAETSCAPAN
jgi:uncharacterized RDD family membrane protein YckC/Tfp pilus assembly protein PilE